jgi:hypothetical protein
MPLTRLNVPLVMNRPGFHAAVLLAASSFHGPFDLVSLGRDVPEGAVKPPVVVPIDPVDGEDIDVSQGLLELFTRRAGPFIITDAVTVPVLMDVSSRRISSQ